jgi:mannose/cellobiose epimerase-like protein (N-acyl-D-glucosamine 2-epimerase family)
MNPTNFIFSDLVAGTVRSVDGPTGSFSVETPGGETVDVRQTSATFAEFVRNLGEPYKDASSQLSKVLTPGAYVFAYGIYYPEDAGHVFEAKHIVLPGVMPGSFVFEEPDWWVNQCKEIADFYIRSQFGQGPIDFHEYRTSLFLDGKKVSTTLQEVDTLSRTVYGFATAYLLTGEDRFYEAAEKGTAYLRKYMCKRDREQSEGVVYWLHALNAEGTRFVEVLGSLFGDDYGAMPCYEQIYALAGPMQTFRVNGDPRIREDADKTIKLFDTYYLDKGPDGGYFSHLTTDSFDPEAKSLGHNQSRKNWNSIGDHAPAYLINLYLATGEARYLEFLERTFDTVCDRFPAKDGSPFVQEKFFKDWSPDKTWGWQQDRAVAGHDLKIAWNLLRINSASPKDRYTELAEQLAHAMAEVGTDHRRGGCYDVVERHLEGGQKFHRLAFHDRKAWWQQEQAILAYLILFGVLKRPEYEKWARETEAFYNAWFLDTDNGAVYFNVLASGLPYLLGNERDKGSHSMGAYHATELCYLAAVYTNLLIRKNPLTLHFKPFLGVLPGNRLRVSPDILPPGSVRIADVRINGVPWTDFDAENLTVSLPEPPDLTHDLRLARIRAGGIRPHSQESQVKVKVNLVPAT